MDTATTVKPQGYESDLSDYGPVVFDMSEPIGWGFMLINHIGEERFEALKEHGDLVFVGRQKVRQNDEDGNLIGYLKPIADWALVVMWLSEEEAVTKFGPINHVEVGPRGGYKFAVYGSRVFHSKRMRPKSHGGPATTGR